MNEQATHITTATAFGVEVRVLDSHPFYFGSFNLLVIILLAFIDMMQEKSQYVLRYTIECVFFCVYVFILFYVFFKSSYFLSFYFIT
jgi:hypothetical protein